MVQGAKGRGVAALLLTIAILLTALPIEAGGNSNRTRSSKSKRTSKSRVARPSCSSCSGRSARKGRSRASRKKAAATAPASCYPKGYVDPKISRKLNAALREMRRAGIKPVITSAWRSSAAQARLHKCSNSRSCRRRHPGLYSAMPPGRSLHEAGLAVDIAGVATGPRGRKRLTARGRRIVRIMRKHGFIWRYGLADPVHFEVDPRRYGYRNASHAIRRSQSQCQMRLAAARKGRPSARPASSRARQTARSVKNRSPRSNLSRMRVTVRVHSPASNRL
ncbi:MAG TPA: M15 family metallopeptidase [Blastocatellia bacterium]|nr:M15 family metallopeptidase [Blastocatellia bacterium]